MQKYFLLLSVLLLSSFTYSSEKNSSSNKFYQSSTFNQNATVSQPMVLKLINYEEMKNQGLVAIKEAKTLLNQGTSEEEVLSIIKNTYPNNPMLHDFLDKKLQRMI